ncbi:NADH:flavin oxidoreductase [bacterium]|nr:NADH:flavin oxidoreductase [bacterium]
MPTLFEQTTIGPLHLSNRFVRSATWEGMAAPDGTATPALIDLMVQLARGGVGLIISGHSYVSAEGQAGPGKLGVHNDAMLPGLTAMAAAVHDAGGRIVLQLAHAGIEAAQKLTGLQPIGPSVTKAPEGVEARVMSPDDIRATVSAFAAAAARARRAGFDGVQIHAAHGYLLSQFLSPYYNKRTDEYGGAIANRARIVVDAVRAIRSAVGRDYPVMIKINSEDFVEGGMTVDESCAVAVMLEQAGISAIELSGGTHYSGNNVPVRRGRKQTVYYRAAAEQCRQHVRVPLMLVGGIRDVATASALVSSGVTDFVSLSRPLIREPGLVGRWRAGDTAPASCISCNMCFKPAHAGEGLYCVTERKELEKQRDEAQ